VRRRVGECGTQHKYRTYGTYIEVEDESIKYLSSRREETLLVNSVVIIIFSFLYARRPSSILRSTKLEGLCVGPSTNSTVRKSYQICDYQCARGQLLDRTTRSNDRIDRSKQSRQLLLQLLEARDSEISNVRRKKIEDIERRASNEDRRPTEDIERRGNERRRHQRDRDRQQSNKLPLP